MTLIAPSILSADFLRLGEEVAALEKAGADFIHVDVMDGHFVPNLTLGPAMVKALKRACKIPLDVHLMITNAAECMDDYLDAGADQLTIHAEAVTHLERAVSHIKSRGGKAGVALNPATHESVLEYVLGELDLVLVMTVNPGFGNQAFLPSSPRKVAAVKAMKDRLKSKCVIAVDGGINEQTAKLCSAAGAGMLIAGSYIFLAGDYRKAMANLRGTRE
jgi:ribulose-phosphate 3-epimerase